MWRVSVLRKVFWSFGWEAPSTAEWIRSWLGEPVWSPAAVTDVHGHLLPKFSAHTMECWSCITTVFGVGISFFRHEQKVPILASLLINVRGTCYKDNWSEDQENSRHAFPALLNCSETSGRGTSVCSVIFRAFPTEALTLQGICGIF